MICPNYRCFGNVERSGIRVCSILSEMIPGDCPFFKDRNTRSAEKTDFDVKIYKNHYEEIHYRKGD